MSTSRTAYVTVVNNWGADVSSIQLSRETDGVTTNFDFGSLGDRGIAPPQPITYWTGVGSRKDFWSITFTDDNDTQWSTKSQLKQGIQTEDEDQVLLVSLDGDNSEMHVFFSSGSDDEDIIQG